MTVPMVVLAAGTVAGAVLNLPVRSLEWLGRWLEPTFGDAPEPASGSLTEGAALAGVALAVSLVGIAVACLLYRRGGWPTDPLATRLEPFAAILPSAFVIDWAYAAALSMVAGTVMVLGWMVLRSLR